MPNIFIKFIILSFRGQLYFGFLLLYKVLNFDWINFFYVIIPFKWKGIKYYFKEHYTHRPDISFEYTFFFNCLFKHFRTQIVRCTSLTHTLAFLFSLYYFPTAKITNFNSKILITLLFFIQFHQNIFRFNITVTNWM